MANSKSKNIIISNYNYYFSFTSGFVCDWYYCFNSNKPNDNSMNYSGTYLEKDNKIILSITSNDVNCDLGKYACEGIITLTKQNDKTLVDNDSLTEKYDKVESLLLVK